MKLCCDFTPVPPVQTRTVWTAAWLGAAGSPLSDLSTPPAVVICMSIACQQGLSEQTPKKRPLHNSLSCRGFRGRGDRIRTYDLLTPSQTLCQAALRPVKFVAGSRESRCPMRPEDHTATGHPRTQATKRKYTVSGGYTKRFSGPFKHSSAACLLHRRPHAIISLCRTISPPYANPVSS